MSPLHQRYKAEFVRMRMYYFLVCQVFGSGCEQVCVEQYSYHEACFTTQWRHIWGIDQAEKSAGRYVDACCIDV